MSRIYEGYEEEEVIDELYIVESRSFRWEDSSIFLDDIETSDGYSTDPLTILERREYAHEDYD